MGITGLESVQSPCSAEDRVASAAILDLARTNWRGIENRLAQLGKSLALILHDTAELSYRHEDAKPIGILQKIPARPPGRPGRPHFYTNCGILMHSSLVTTVEGLPLGLAAIKFWTRDKFHGANALKRKINPTRIPIEQKESMRSLENLRHSTELPGDPGRKGAGHSVWYRKPEDHRLPLHREEWGGLSSTPQVTLEPPIPSRLHCIKRAAWDASGSAYPTQIQLIDVVAGKSRM